MMNKFKHTFGVKIGLQITHMENGKTEGVLKITQDHLNSSGRVHGGVLCTIADTLCGAALTSKIPVDLAPATTDFNISFLKAARTEEISGVAEVIHFGRRTAYAECALFSGDILIAKATVSFVTVKRNVPPAKRPKV